MARAELMDFDKALELFEPVIGLEVHVELNTTTKMFSSAPNPANSQFHGAEPNTLITPVCLGLPGSLPVVNGDAVKYSISLGLALGCEIAPSSRFARKNYFYPDLAKNYQISQYDEPIAFEGSVEVELADGRTFQVPVRGYRLVVLADLVVLGLVGVKVVLPGEPAPRCDVTVERQADPNGRLDRGLVEHR